MILFSINLRYIYTINLSINVIDGLKRKKKINKLNLKNKNKKGLIY